MRKIILSLFLLPLFFLFTLKSVSAVECKGDYTPKDLYEDSTLTITIENTKKDHKYFISIQEPEPPHFYKHTDTLKAQNTGEILTWSIRLSDYRIIQGTYLLVVTDVYDGVDCLKTIFQVKPAAQPNPDCPPFYKIFPESPTENDEITLAFKNPPQTGTTVIVDNYNKIFELLPPNTGINIGTYKIGKHSFSVSPMTDPKVKCYETKYFTVTKGGCVANVEPQSFTPGQEGTLSVTGSSIVSGKDYFITFDKCEGGVKCDGYTFTPGSLTYEFRLDGDLRCSDGEHQILVGYKGAWCQTGKPLCATSFSFGGRGISGGFQPQPCDVMGTTGIETALGCIPTGDTTGFISWILKFAIGIGGGIAFLLMLFGVFQIITSSGDPERLKAGKELITSALIGLLMIIFSLFLLQLVGVQILQIPGFSK